VRARQVARPDRPDPFLGLEVPQDFEGLREFFRGSGHDLFPSGFVLPLSLCVVPCLYYCAVRLFSYYVVPFLSYCVEKGLVRPAWKCGPYPAAHGLFRYFRLSEIVKIACT